MIKSSIESDRRKDREMIVSSVELDERKDRKSLQVK